MIDEVAVKTGMMVRVLLHHSKVSGRRAVSFFTGRNRPVGDDLITDHEIGALFRKGDDNGGIVWRRLSEELLIHLQLSLLLNQLAWFLHLRPEQLCFDGTGQRDGR